MVTCVAILLFEKTIPHQTIALLEYLFNERLEILGDQERGMECCYDYQWIRNELNYI